MDWIYLSPHLDDVALSCGGLAWEGAQAGNRVQVWTVCGGDPPPGIVSPFAASLHERWKTGAQAAEQRRNEDCLACAQLGATCVHFSWPDCIYRTGPDGTALYASEESLFGPLHPGEYPLIDHLAAELAEGLPAEVLVVCPLALGNHVDHQLVRAAAEKLGTPLLYYADYPYVLKAGAALHELAQAGWEPVDFPVSTAGLEAWQAGIAAHASQISSFWGSLEAMRAAVEDYWRPVQGVRLWRAPHHSI